MNPALHSFHGYWKLILQSLEENILYVVILNNIDSSYHFSTLKKELQDLQNDNFYFTNILLSKCRFYKVDILK